VAGFALLAASGVAVLTWTSGCRKEAPKPPPVAEDAAQREKAASIAFQHAMAAPIPEKYEALKRLMAVYDDTQRGQDAYLELVVLLVRERPPQFEEALRVAKNFRDRHPKDPRVGEAFLQIADISYTAKKPETRAAALEAWSKHLEERDVAGDVPKAGLYYDFVRLRLRQEKWKDADVAIDTALAEDGLKPEERVEILVRKGNLLAEKLGDVPGARAAFAKALELSNNARSAGAGSRMIPPELIEAEIQRVDGK
jgi:tetratricopeptide (TPR) repeat protein